MIALRYSRVKRFLKWDIITDDFLVGTIHEIFKWFDENNIIEVATNLSCFFTEWETDTTKYTLNLRTMTWANNTTNQPVEGDYPYKGTPFYPHLAVF